MRGPDRRTEGLFSYVSCESRVPAGHPLRSILPVADAALAALSGEFQQLYAAERPALDRAGEAAAGPAAAGVLLGPLRAAADGAAGLQPLVPLVRRARRRRPGLGRDGVHQEPRPAARGRDRGQVPARGARAAQGQGAPVGRALLGRRHADPGLGVDEELPAEGRLRASRRRRAATASATSTASSGPTTPTPRPPIPRPGCSARAKARRPSSASWATLLMENRHGLLVDGRVSEATGTAEREVAETMLAAVPGRHPITLGGDKSFDTAGFVTAMRELQGHPACRPEHHQPPLGDRRPDHAPSRLRGEPADPQADRGGVWLDQGDRPAAPRPAPRQGSRRLAVHPGGRRLQPDPAAQAAGRHDGQAHALSPPPLEPPGVAASRPHPTGDLEPSPQAVRADIHRYFRSLQPGFFHGTMRLDRIATAMIRAYLFGTGPGTMLPSFIFAFIKTRSGLEVPDIEFMF